MAAPLKPRSQVQNERAIERIAGYTMNPYRITELQFYDARRELIQSLERDIQDAKSVTFASYLSTYKPKP